MERKENRKRKRFDGHLVWMETTHGKKEIRVTIKTACNEKETNHAPLIAFWLLLLPFFFSLALLYIACSFFLFACSLFVCLLFACSLLFVSFFVRLLPCLLFA
jgi:hypothetical protein